MCLCVVCFKVTLQKKAQLIFLAVGRKAKTTMIVWLGKRNLEKLWLNYVLLLVADKFWHMVGFGGRFVWGYVLKFRY